MRGFIRTLFGDVRTLITAALCVAFAMIVLHTRFYPAAGITLPLTLLVGAAYLAKK
jgi:hypothetical protein